MAKSSSLSVGLISDTHGLLRPQAIEALQGVHRIIHAGDIGGEEVLAALRHIAPVDAIRGNNDRDAWARHIPAELTVDLGGVAVHVLHDLKDLDVDPTQAGLQVIVSGHSHKPDVRQHNGVLYVNPGSAGPRRFRLPVTIGRLDIASGCPTARICYIL